jgi:hypothetical protein
MFSRHNDVRKALQSDFVEETRGRERVIFQTTGTAAANGGPPWTISARLPSFRKPAGWCSLRIIRWNL